MGVAGVVGAAATMSACLVSGIALLLLDFATITVSSYGASKGWLYDNSSDGLDKRDFGNTGNYQHGEFGYRHLTGDIYTHGSDYHDTYLQSLFEEYAPRKMVNITYAAPIYSNTTGTMVHLGYSIEYRSGFGRHIAFGESGAEVDMISTLDSFNGTHSTLGAFTHQVGEDRNSLKKRSSSSPWMSYTDWGTNTGYDEDIMEWDEMTKFAREYAYDDPTDMIGSAQSCTTSTECYYVRSKGCVTVGFSETQGQEDAMAGEVYYGSYGGVDGQCDQG